MRAFSQKQSPNSNTPPRPPPCAPHHNLTDTIIMDLTTRDDGDATFARTYPYKYHIYIPFAVLSPATCIQYMFTLAPNTNHTHTHDDHISTRGTQFKRALYLIFMRATIRPVGELKGVLKRKATHKH